MKASFFTDEELRAMLGALAHARIERGEVPQFPQISTIDAARHDLAAGDDLGDDSERPEQWPQWRRDYHAQRVSEARWVAVGLGVGILAVTALGFLCGWLVEVCR